MSDDDDGPGGHARAPAVPQSHQAVLDLTYFLPILHHAQVCSDKTCSQLYSIRYSGKQSLTATSGSHHGRKGDNHIVRIPIRYLNSCRPFHESGSLLSSLTPSDLTFTASNSLAYTSRERQRLCVLGAMAKETTYP